MRTHEYISADTAPPGYAVRRPVWLALLFLASFLSAAALVQSQLQYVIPAYARLLSSTTGAPYSDLISHASLSLRPYIFLFLLLLGVFAPGSARARAHFVTSTSAAFLLITLLSDTIMADNRFYGAPLPLKARGGVLAVVVELVFLVWVIFTKYHLPPAITIPRSRSPLTRYTITLLLAVFAVGAVVFVTTPSRDTYMRVVHLPLLNGFAASLVLFLFGIEFILFLVGSLQKDRRPTSGPDLTVAFIVPAHNEAHNIADVVRALDAAAAQLGRTVRALIINNASSDATASMARLALAQCHHIAGDVLECPRPGKSYALNMGLENTTEDIVIRVDADTIVQPDLLTRVMPYFWNVHVGGVSGLPMPRKESPRWIRSVRTMEVLFSVGFLRVGQSAADGVLVMPGNMSAYRGTPLRQLGGFGVGFNGEDTDIAVQLGRLGYRVVTDLDIEFYPEVPPTIGGLREQRQRWARGIVHVGARHRSSISMAQGARGLLWLPWAMVNAVRRAVMVPLFLCSGVVVLVRPNAVTLRQIAVVGGLLIGSNLAALLILLLKAKRFSVIPYLPAYFAFRAFKLYVAFEMLLTLALPEQRQPLERTVLRDHPLPAQ